MAQYQQNIIKKKKNTILYFVKKEYLYPMKTKEITAEKLVKVPQKGLLSLVASKLKNKVLFPEKLEEAKQYLKKIELANS